MWRHTSFNRGLALARQALREFRPEEAIECLLPLSDRHPDSAEAEFLLGTAYRRTRRLDQVAPHLKRALELGWDQKEVDRQFCLTFFQAGDFRRSASELDDQLQERANDDEAEETYEAMVRGYTTAMLINQANFVVEGWLRWRPKSAPAYLLKAEVANLAGDDAEELACYREAVRCDPKNYEARQRLAHALVNANEIDVAAELYQGCLDENPRDPETLVGLAQCWQRQGRTDEAKELVARALDAQPSQKQRAAGLAVSGQIALEAKDYALASRLFEQAIDAHPSALASVYSLAQALSRSGRGDEAGAYLARFERMAGLEKRLEGLHEELLNDPGNSELRTEVGEILLEYGSTKAGENWLLTALLYDPENTRAHRRLAQHYEQEGLTEPAAYHREMAARAFVVPEMPLTPLLERPADQDADEKDALIGEESDA